MVNSNHAHITYRLRDIENHHFLSMVFCGPLAEESPAMAATRM